MSTQPQLSVIICTHNPRYDYLKRVLQALQKQTFPTKLWEILLIDNASDTLVSSEIDLSWHPQSRHIQEEKLGLTSARLRGIKEAVGEILVFVDDDNVLDSDYLEVAFKISKDFSIIGAWGGQVVPELEAEPPEWMKPELQNLLKNLACREFERDKWSNLIHEYETTPCGAGLCIRKNVAEKYAELIQNDPKRVDLDRKGQVLISCGDFDLAYTACDMGLGTGEFASLKLTHLIPPHRLEEDYMVRLIEGIYYSRIILEYLRGKLPPKPNWRSSKIYFLYLHLRYGARRCRLYVAGQKGIKLAIKDITHWQTYTTT
ncbi:MAG: glycosyltransferase [Chlorogloeopsis fritschii C42_A2020_084]|uniref:glycosyltransferase n=1 Tax=Chlorogloeopsis fritschii TaxID=1124 RepID=UPI001A05ACFB|nr:glycosyltransferase [Chlorogloeopsis fritschii]MBF2004224.1 glycosyltransferase [Chlorogloeopsis fritschii C42_A2020_084]